MRCTCICIPSAWISFLPLSLPLPKDLHQMLIHPSKLISSVIPPTRCCTAKCLIIGFPEPWFYSICQFQAINAMLLNTELGRDVYLPARNGPGPAGSSTPPPLFCAQLLYQAFGCLSSQEMASTLKAGSTLSLRLPPSSLSWGLHVESPPCICIELTPVSAVIT